MDISSYFRAVLTGGAGSHRRKIEVSEMTPEKAIDVLYSDRATFQEFEEAVSTAVKALKEKRTRGQWIWKSYDMKHDCGDIVCSICTCVIYEGVPKARLLKAALWSYCPNCGSDNRKKEGK